MEAYLKKLCFEYQVDEREVKELLARMEMVYLDKGETIASATLPEQSLYIIISFGYIVNTRYRSIMKRPLKWVEQIP